MDSYTLKVTVILSLTFEKSKMYLTNFFGVNALNASKYYQPSGRSYFHSIFQVI